MKIRKHMILTQLPSPGHTFTDHAARFMTVKRHKWTDTDKTLEAYKNVLNLYSQFSDDAWPPDFMDVIHWFNDMNDRELTTATIHSYWSHLRAFFYFSEAVGWLAEEQNPVYHIKNLDVEPDKPRLLPKSYADPDMTKVIKNLRRQADGNSFRSRRAIRDLAILLFAYTTGAWAGEITSLTLRNLDLQTGIAQVAPDLAKDKDPRPLVFDAETASAISDYLMIRPENGADQVFLSTGGRVGVGKPLSANALRQMLKRRCEEMKVDYQNFHSLRHTFAYDAIDAGVSVPMVQKQLGHSNLTTTMRYTMGRTPEQIAAFREAAMSKRLDQQ